MRLPGASAGLTRTSQAHDGGAPGPADWFVWDSSCLFQMGPEASGLERQQTETDGLVGCPSCVSSDLHSPSAPPSSSSQRRSVGARSWTAARLVPAVCRGPGEEAAPVCGRRNRLQASGPGWRPEGAGHMVQSWTTRVCVFLTSLDGCLMRSFGCLFPQICSWTRSSKSTFGFFTGGTSLILGTKAETSQMKTAGSRCSSAQAVTAC